MSPINNRSDYRIRWRAIAINRHKSRIFGKKQSNIESRFSTVRMHYIAVKTRASLLGPYRISHAQTSVCIL